MILLHIPARPLVVATRYGQYEFTVWVRGTEVKIQGYVEPREPLVGMMRDSLVIEDLVPVQHSRTWREIDLDDLIATGEYKAIEREWFEFYENRAYHYSGWSEDEEPGWEKRLFNAHVRWLNYWLTA